VGVLRVNKAPNGMSPGRTHGAARGASPMRSYAAALHCAAVLKVMIPIQDVGSSIQQPSPPAPGPHHLKHRWRRASRRVS